MDDQRFRPGRADDLERLLGDPYDRDSALGFPAIVAADERAEMLAAGEQALDAYQLNAELVPAAYGGRLTRLDHLVEIMRSVYRRDPTLGLGYGGSSLIAGVNVWTAGDEAQQRRVAELLLDNRKLACAFHELEHGNDMAGTEFAAAPDAERLVLKGRKEVITNIARADAFVLLARTDSRAGSRSHSQLLVEAAHLPPDRVRYLPRFATSGMRGLPLAGVELLDCPVPAGSVLGELGHGLETALRSLQITRTTLVAMATGALDTGLRTALRHARSRRLYGAPVVELPQVRSVLVNAFVDLLVCECFAAVATRALHLLPEQASIYAVAVKYHLAQVLLDALSRLSSVLGSQFYIRDGEHEVFQKLLRDSRAVGFAHIARPLCQVSLLPQLPLLARRSWTADRDAPAELFDLDGPLPPVPFGELRVSAGGRDRLSPSLAAAVQALAAEHGPDYRQARVLAEAFLQELRTVASDAAALPLTELAVTASPHSYDLTTRYIRILAATACLQVWRHQQHRGDPFLQDPAWLAAALHRLGPPWAGGSAPAVAPLPEPTGARLFAELVDRHESGHGFGIARSCYHD